jgi:hypothetical protein
MRPFNVIGNPDHPTPAINFENSSAAGTAQIVLGQKPVAELYSGAVAAQVNHAVLKIPAKP